jgi:hypothetical protein
MAAMAKNRRLSYCKAVEVIAETTAPLLPIEQLLSTVPSQRVSFHFLSLLFLFAFRSRSNKLVFTGTRQIVSCAYLLV